MQMVSEEWYESAFIDENLFAIFIIFSKQSSTKNENLSKILKVKKEKLSLFILHT